MNMDMDNQSKYIKIINTALIVGTFAMGVIFQWNIILIGVVAYLIYSYLYGIKLPIAIIAPIVFLLYVGASFLTIFPERTSQSEAVFIIFYIGLVVLIGAIVNKLIYCDADKNELFQWNSLRKYINITTLLNVIVTVSVIAFGIYFQWAMVDIAMLLVLLWSFLAQIPSQKLAIVALTFLIVAPLLLAVDRETQAEQYAVYAYYFLVMATMRAITELQNEKS